MKLQLCVSLMAIAMLATPALAEGDGTRAFSAETVKQLPDVLSPAERDAYRAVFAAIRAGAWTDAAAKLDAIPNGVLTPFARAELYTAKGSPKVEPGPLADLLNSAPYLPQAPQLLIMAQKRGATPLPTLPAQQKLIWLGGQPTRERASSVKEDPAGAQLAPKILPLIKVDDPAGCEAVLTQEEPNLSGPALTEWRQRVAWVYYLNGDDINARRLATLAQTGDGEWRVQADWTVGLAAWRQHDYPAAEAAFASVASRGSDSEIKAAGYYWAARAAMASDHPERVQARLRAAALNPETFYGLLASQALGLAAQPLKDMHALAADWDRLSATPNLKIAKALAEIGETSLAADTLKYQARIGEARNHPALIAMAAQLNLPDTQIWLAHNGPAGAASIMAARYPMPDWTPDNGWRVDRQLVYAHALQESRFRTDAVSPAGAYGVMQVLPGTADLIARRRGQPNVDKSLLTRPAINLDYGQARLEQIRDYGATGGLLPKVIAGYNAGPGMLDVWNATVYDEGDPLLFIESIPYWETRGYVATVMRNYWVYERKAGQTTPSLKAMAEGMWPRFPGMPGAEAVRVAARPRPPRVQTATRIFVNSPAPAAAEVARQIAVEQGKIPAKSKAEPEQVAAAGMPSGDR